MLFLSRHGVAYSGIHTARTKTCSYYIVGSFLQDRCCIQLIWIPATVICIALYVCNVVSPGRENVIFVLRGAIRGGSVHARDDSADAATWRQERERYSAGQHGRIRWGCCFPDCRGGHSSPLVLKLFRGASPSIQNVRCTVLKAAM